MTEADVVEKYDAMASAVLGTERAAELRSLILEGDPALSVSRLYELMTP